MSVVIVTWNAAPVLGACLDSVARQRLDGGFETIVVDNASADDTAAVLARHAGSVRVLVNARNEGFSAGNNLAATQARGRILLFLNSDTELLADDVLERLADAAEAPGTGIVGPLLLNPDGSVQPSCAAHPSIARAIVVSSGLHKLLPARARARVMPERAPHDRPREAPWLMGAALALRADLFRELGGFWPTLYAEEQDLARRVQDRGLQVRLEPSARVMHIGNHSNAQRMSTPGRGARIAHAELVFLRAHHSRPSAAAIRVITGLGYAARALAHRALGRRDEARLYRAMARVYARPHDDDPQGWAAP